ncbi:uncharacterized protein FMAN_03940 [Fusarium mangiferae]|uniref:Negative acting factor n=1 Tax=Fusarium mangiferae TaxID=192010 RepID=A0A1L7UCQ5_FUSMA|nr:uncharacterized protein FMAN_03940 [Fusarium mangiferae]CVL06073.1 uncharacterized protein FMAN_03940 [Fusarium mangiferae]
MQFLPTANNPLQKGSLPPSKLSTNIIPQPHSVSEHEAIAYFLQEYSVQPGSGGFGGHLDTLQDMYESSHRESCLQKATLATAYLCLSRHYKSSALYSLAYEYRGAALRAINRDLASTSSSFKDKTLTSIMFMGMMEDIDPQGVSKKPYHMLGIARIYEVAGHRLLNNIHKRQLDGWIFSELQIPSLNADKPLDCLTVPDTDLETGNFYIRLAHIATRITHFCRRAKQLSSGRALEASERQTLLRDKLVSVMQQGMSIQSELVELKGSLPPQWSNWQTKYEQLASTVSPAHISRWIACLGCGFNMTLMLFFNTFLSCCRTLVRIDYRNKRPTLETRLAETSMPLAAAQLKRLVASICKALPYMMGEVDERGARLPIPQPQAIVAYRLIWPLAVVIVSPQSTHEQIQDCRARLNWIRDQYGMKLASDVITLAKDLMN